MAFFDNEGSVVTRDNIESALSVDIPALPDIGFQIPQRTVSDGGGGDPPPPAPAIGYATS